MLEGRHRIAFALAAGTVVAGLVLGVARADDEGLPLPPRRGAAMAPFAPVTAQRPEVPDAFALEGAWRVEGQDVARGPFRGVVRFSRVPGKSARYYRYEREVTYADGAREAERGEAGIGEGRLCSRQEPAAVTAGLRAAFGEGQAGEGAPLRRAIYRLATDGRRFDGEFRYSGGGRAGRERLEPQGPDAPNNDVTLLVDGPEMFPALRAALGAARRSIALQTFIYTDDSTGRPIARLLCQKAREGVTVRLMIDNVGDKLGRELKRELKDAGVEVIIQHGWGEGIKESVLGAARGLWNGLRGLFGGKTKPREARGLLNHDHRKITVVDGQVAFCGGMNIAREYERDWHDIHSVVRGAAATKLEELFFDRWRAAGGQGEPLPPAAGDAPSWPGSMAVDVVASLPGLSTAIKDRYLAELAACRDRALIENAYFLDDDIIHALQAAVRRSCRSVVILPGDEEHDVPAVRDAFNWVQNDVVRSGVEVYKYRDRMVHSKVASFDGRLATVGSSNLDNMALTKLAEVNLFVLDRGFARTLEERVFARDIPMSDRQQERKLSWWEKVKAGTLNFVRGIL